MAYTDQNIIDAYNQAMAGGATEAQFVERAQSMGISNDQLASARGTMLGGSSTQSPASNVVSTVTSAKKDPYSSAQYEGAKTWASGKNMDEILSKASSIGLTSEQLGKVLGVSGEELYNYTGYGRGASGFNPDGSLKYQYGWANSADPTKGGYSQAYVGGQTQLKDWTWDKDTQFKYTVPTPKPTQTGPVVAAPVSPVGSVGTGSGATTTTPAPQIPPKNQWMPDAPATGINLSQIQTATPWEVAKNQTVQSQLEQIIAADSPLMQQARMRALQAANSRGLLNSSMAVSAGESALYDAAMPIAQQDASTYADAGRFNADAQNTFSRDNNAFVRDAFMADFNLAANEWAKQKDQIRSLETMNAQQRLTLERDAIQNGYQSARDAILNGYQVQRDEVNNSFTLKRDETQNQFTAGQQEKQNQFTADQQAKQNAYAAQQAELDRQAAMARVAAGQSPDNSLDRLNAQINADRDVNALKVRQGAQDTITNARSQLNKDLINIKGTSGLSTEVKDQMVADAINSYNTIVNGHLSSAGWTADAWEYKVTAAPAPAPAAASNVVQNVAQGGSGAQATFMNDGA